VFVSGPSSFTMLHGLSVPENHYICCGHLPLLFVALKWYQ